MIQAIQRSYVPMIADSRLITDLIENYFFLSIRERNEQKDNDRRGMRVAPTDTFELVVILNRK